MNLITKIGPLLGYRSPLWGSLPQYLKVELKCVQKRVSNLSDFPLIICFLEDGRDKAVGRELDPITKNPKNPTAGNKSQ